MSKAYITQLKHKSEYKGVLLDVLDDMKSDILDLNEDLLPHNKYMQSGIAYSGNPNFMYDCGLELGERIQKLGQHEYELLKFIISGANKFFCYVGPPGSGKTTRINYLYNNFVSSPARYHCYHPSCLRKRILFNIDFNIENYYHVTDRNAARKQLIDDMVEMLELNLFGWVNEEGQATAPFKPNQDIYGFWDWAIKEIENNNNVNKKPALRKLKNKINDNPDQRMDPNFRRTATNEIIANPSDKLDYLFCVLHYLNNIVYNPTQKCAMILFDNIDYADPFIQEELLQTIKTRIRPYNLNLCIVTREDTFQRNRKNFDLYEVRKHEGPKPTALLHNKLEHFLTTNPNPKVLNDNYHFQNNIEAKNVFDHLMKIKEILVSAQENYNVFTIFIDFSMRSFLRSMLLASQYLIYNRLDFISLSNRTSHHFLRAFLRFSHDFFNNDLNSPICNLLFCRIGHKNYPLLKLRILTYLNSLPIENDYKHERVSVITRHLKGFDYPKLAIEEALSDLSNPYHQLIFSNNTNSVTDIAKENENDIIFLTEAGKSYLNNICMSIDYLCEMIVSIPIDKDDFIIDNKTTFLTERIHALFYFLRNLIELETADSKVFIKKINIDEYTAVYSDYLLSFDIILKIWDHFCRIRNSVIKYKPKYKDEFCELALDYLNIFNLAKNENETFNELVQREISLDLSERIQLVESDYENFLTKDECKIKLQKNIK